MGSKRKRGKIELEAIGSKVYSTQRFISLQRYIKSFKPDAILTDSPGFSVSYAYLLGKIYNLPAFIWFRGNCYEEARETFKLMSFSGKIGSICKMLSTNIFAKKAVAIFAISDWLRNELVEELKIPGKDIRTIYPSIDLTRFRSSNNPYLFKIALGLPQDTRLFLTVMNFKYPMKVAGLLHFIEPIGEVLKEYKDVKYVIAGAGNLRRLVERKIENLDLKQSVLLAGYIERIEEAYAAYEFLIHTSFLESAG